jgi:hypothetical protein
MSEIQVNRSGERKRSRKLYSKGGCKECKRRKIKCNEAKPSCWQCQRLSKLCQYPPIKERKTPLHKKKNNLAADLRQSEILNQAHDAESLPAVHTTRGSDTSVHDLVDNSMALDSNESSPKFETLPSILRKS